MCPKNWDASTPAEISSEQEIDSFFTAVQWWEIDHGDDSTEEGKKCKQVATILLSKEVEITSWVRKYVKKIALAGRQFAHFNHFEILLKDFIPEINITDLPVYKNLSVDFSTLINHLAFGDK